MRRAVWIIVTLGLLAVAGKALQYAVHNTVETARRQKVMGNYSQISFAIGNYEQLYGPLTPALRGEDGKPALSWRVAILPFIEGQDLYERFHLDEPWDSPHNLNLLEEMPQIYGTAHEGVLEPGRTFCRAITGKRPNKDTERVLMLVEGKEAVPWTKPDELPFERGKMKEKIGGEFSDGSIAALADGSERWFDRELTTEKELEEAIFTKPSKNR